MNDKQRNKKMRERFKKDSFEKFASLQKSIDKLVEKLEMFPVPDQEEYEYQDAKEVANSVMDWSEGGTFTEELVAEITDYISVMTSSRAEALRAWGKHVLEEMNDDEFNDHPQIEHWFGKEFSELMDRTAKEVEKLEKIRRERNLKADDEE